MEPEDAFTMVVDDKFQSEFLQMTSIAKNKTPEFLNSKLPQELKDLIDSEQLFKSYAITSIRYQDCVDLTNFLAIDRNTGKAYYLFAVGDEDGKGTPGGYWYHER